MEEMSILDVLPVLADTRYSVADRCGLAYKYNEVFKKEFDPIIDGVCGFIAEKYPEEKRLMMVGDPKEMFHNTTYFLAKLTDGDGHDDKEVEKLIQITRKNVEKLIYIKNILDAR